MSSEMMFERPAVLADGQRVVALPDGASVQWEASRWGVEPVVSPRARRGDASWPSWPQFSDRSIGDAVALLHSHRDGGEGLPLGYLGPREKALEERYAKMIGPDEQGRGAQVFAVSNGTDALLIAYLAALEKRQQVEGWAMPAVPNAVTSVRSFEATWTALARAGIRPVFVDVDPETGCATADAIDAAIDRDTVLLTVPGLYDRLPECEGIGQVAFGRDLPFVLDSAHAHLATWRGRHVATFAGIIVVSGQGSKIVTGGSEMAFIVTFDPMLAALVAKIRNVGRGLQPAPAWWPRHVPAVAGENARGGELEAILMGGSFDSYEELLPNRELAQAGLRAGLGGHRGPWRMLPAQPQAGGMMYKATLLFEPELSDKPAAWAQIGWAAAQQMLAEELLTEVATSYPPPWEAASEYHPRSREWMWAQLMPDIDPGAYPNAARLAATAHMLPHEFLARRGAAAQALRAINKLHAGADHPEVLAWARNNPA